MVADNRVQKLLDERTNFYSAITRERYLEASTERLTAFDEEIHGIKDSLALLLRQRNTLVTACILPVELLCHILSDLSELEPHFYPNPADHEKYASGVLRPRMGWIKAATQVCHTWRQAAFADSRLWKITTTSLGSEWDARMLRLNGGRPAELDVWDGWDHESWKPDSSLQSILESVVKIQAIGPDLNWAPLQRLAMPPILRALRLHTFSEHGQYPVVSQPLFERTLGGSLRELYMHNFLVELTAIRKFPRSITRLELTTTQRSDTGYWHRMPFLVGCLDQFPKLESLTIKRYFFYLDENDIIPDNLTPIERPHLVNVDIFSSWDAIFLVLLRLRASPNVRFNLASTFPSDSPPEPEVAEQIHSLLADYLTEHPETSFLSKMQSVEWRASAPTEWRGKIAGTDVPSAPVDPVFRKTLVLSAWHADNPDYLLSDYVGFGHTPPPDFRFAFQCDDEFVPRYTLDEVLPLNAFPAARCFSLQSGRFEFKIFNWDGLFNTSSLLTWLRLDRNIAETFLNVRLDTWESLPDGVKTLALLGVDWRYDIDEDSGVDGSLARLWRTRREDGLPLERVIVGHSSLHHDYFHKCVHDAGVVFTGVHRPEWLREGHDDYDDETEW